MKSKIINTVVAASILALSAPSFAAGSDLTGRNLVEFLEADAAVGKLVDVVIKTQKISCKRPNLLKTNIDLEVRTFSIRQECHVQNNLDQKSTITISGDVEGDSVFIGSFHYKVTK